MSQINKIAILGGTFDPIHLGHLHLATEVYRQLQPDILKLIPCYQSSLKELPQASAKQRLTMLKLALLDHPELEIDTREIESAKISYMVDTLHSLRQEFPKATLSLIMGDDAFMEFELWHKWQEIIELAQLVIATRHKTTFKKKITKNILFIDINPLPISASEIRRFIKKKKSIAHLVPEKVREYIDAQKLYH